MVKGCYWKNLKIYKACKKLFFIRLFQNCSLKKYIFNIVLSKIINLAALIYAISDSSE